MRRIEKAFEVVENLMRCEIIDNFCPDLIDPSLPNFDINTFKHSDDPDGPGCRGITCEECWDMELE